MDESHSEGDCWENKGLKLLFCSVNTTFRDLEIYRYLQITAVTVSDLEV